MKPLFVVMVIVNSIFVVKAIRNASCGLENSGINVVYEGEGDITTYPWMGTLFYPLGKKKLTTVVVLVTKQMVIGSANEIDKIPKADIRARSRVVLGQNCKRAGIKVRDYTFHPDYTSNTYGALAMVQLEVDHIQHELRPICPPPAYFIHPQVYALTTSDSCKTGKIRIRKMKHVDTDRCKNFYRKSGLDVDMFWPSHTTCAQALSGGRCLWRSGTVLVMKQGRRWGLLGFSVYGPGCRAPARFLDYGMHQQWVMSSIARIGQPAITRMSENHLIMRRSLSNVQRFGHCDPEETNYEIFTDEISIKSNNVGSKASYNVSLYADVEYSCIILKAAPLLPDEPDAYISSEETPTTTDNNTTTTTPEPQPEPTNPKLYLRRWCAGPPQLCHGFQYAEIHFYVDILFHYSTKFNILVYGKTAKVIDVEKAMEYTNKMEEGPLIKKFESILKGLEARKDEDRDFRWFYNKDVGKKQKNKRNHHQFIYLKG